MSNKNFLRLSDCSKISLDMICFKCLYVRVINRSEVYIQVIRTEGRGSYNSTIDPSTRWSSKTSLFSS